MFLIIIIICLLPTCFKDISVCDKVQGIVYDKLNTLHWHLNHEKKIAADGEFFFIKSSIAFRDYGFKMHSLHHTLFSFIFGSLGQQHSIVHCL